MYRHATVCLLAAFFAVPALAVNENTTIVLHANDGMTSCEGPQQAGLDCETVLPTIDVTGMDLAMILVYVRNHDSVACLQCAFDWPVTWSFAGTAWGCQVAQLTILQPSAPGPDAGSVATCFDAVTGGMLAPIGAMIFAMPGAGCLDIIESAYPYGTHVVHPGSVATPIPPENRGRVCAGPGGHTACEPASTPVEETSWARIKAHYR